MTHKCECALHRYDGGDAECGCKLHAAALSLLEALEAVAPALHEASEKMGCYTSVSFEVCDTTLCIQTRAAIQAARQG